MKRRDILAGAAALGLVSLGAPLARLSSAGAATRTIRDAFAAGSEQEGLDILFPGTPALADDSVKLALPWLATAEMPVMARVDCDRAFVQAIAITAPNAARPLVTLAILRGTAGSFSARIRLRETSPVNAWVLTETGLLTASRTIKITRGGYGTSVR